MLGFSYFQFVFVFSQLLLVALSLRRYDFSVIQCFHLLRVLFFLLSSKGKRKEIRSKIQFYEPMMLVLIQTMSFFTIAFLFTFSIYNHYSLVQSYIQLFLLFCSMFGSKDIGAYSSFSQLLLVIHALAEISWISIAALILNVWQCLVHSHAIFIPF